MTKTSTTNAIHAMNGNEEEYLAKLDQRREIAKLNAQITEVLTALALIRQDGRDAHSYLERRLIELERLVGELIHD